MYRLKRLLQKIHPFNEEIPQVFYEHIHTLKLAPGDEIPEIVPNKSWIFVEDGFLLLRQRTAGCWICGNIYFEGTSTVFCNIGVPEAKIDRFQVKAVEHSTVLYLTPADQEKVRSVYPLFSNSRAILNHRSYSKHLKRSAILKVGIQDRVRFVEKFFPFLFRAPAHDLAQILRIKSKTLQMALISAQKKWRSKRTSNNNIG
jgi:hypothetical protein